jgi:hypothetical protein
MMAVLDVFSPRTDEIEARHVMDAVDQWRPVATGRISLFGQGALIRGSARSEIFVDQPHPMAN